MTPLETTLNLDNLRSRFRYDPHSGLIYRVKSGSWLCNIGKPTGKLCKDGYVRISINSTYFSAHRVAWALHHGAFPVQQIDHINRVRSDNRIVNLREVSMRENQTNKGRNIDLVGTTYLPSINKWQAQIKLGDRYRYLGTFGNQTDARCAYLAALAQAEAGRMTPDLIHDTALLTVSRWQRETTQERGNRLLWRDQAERWEANDNHQDLSLIHI